MLPDPRHALRSALLRLAARVQPRPLPPAGTSPRILLIRPDHLGDVLFLTPALHALRQAQPSAEISVLVGPWAAGLLRGNPDVDHVVTLPFPWFDRQPKGRPWQPYQRLLAGALPLRGRYDVAVICRFDHWWGAWLAAAAGIPRRIGYALPDVLPFLTEALPYQPGHHEVVQNLALLDPLGTPRRTTPAAHPLRYPLDDAARSALRARLTEAERQGPLLAIHPGSGALVKRWQVPRWAELMARLHATHGAHFLVTGGPGEEELAAAVVAASPVPARSLAGQTSLHELAALFAECALVLGPDSGPLHLAVAVGRPTIHLYGPVSPATFGPWGEPTRNLALHQQLACQFCHRLDWQPAELPAHPCISAIPVDWVAEAAGRVLATPTPTKL